MSPSHLEHYEGQTAKCKHCGVAKVAHTEADHQFEPKPGDEWCYRYDDWVVNMEGCEPVDCLRCGQDDEDQS
jgi:hypothetical protein|tara:strand:+ start:17 stop:232 length:216 start_codon:yes stop_codon:yes gene_type:complete